MKHLPKVFVIDDESAMTSLLRQVLITHGYEVRFFRSVEEFMVLHHPTQVGCVLVDVSKPDQGGSELLKFLKDSGSLLSIVLISGLVHATTLDPSTGRTTGVLEDPYELSALMSMIGDGVSGSFRRRAERHRNGQFD